LILTAFMDIMVSYLYEMFWEGKRIKDCAGIRSDSERAMKTKTASVILSFILLVGVSRALGEEDANQNPVIGKSTGRIVFGGNVTSKTFKIWNAGSGTLDYDLTVEGDDAEYFTIDGNNGQLEPNEIKTHTVAVDYNDVHNETLEAQIAITGNASNSPQYIELRATESIASRVFRIEIEQGIDYGVLGEDDIPVAENGPAWDTSCDGFGLRGDFDCDGDVDFIDFCLFAQQWQLDGSNLRADISPDCGNTIVNIEDLIVFCENWLKSSPVGITYGFRLSVETDETVEDVEFITPEGEEYSISDVESTEAGLVWTYREWFSEADGLNDYGDGKYTIIVYYADGDEGSTVVNLGIPNKPGAIGQPTQKPILTSPLPFGQTVNPVQFGWEQCSDANVGSIRLSCRKRCGDASMEWEFGRGTRKTKAFNLSVGTWLTEMSFGRWYKSVNEDGIEIEAGKCSRSRSKFETMKWFGTFGDKKNYPLKVMNCDDREVTFSLTGGGFGRIEGGCSFEKIILDGTTEKSVFRVTAKKDVVAGLGDVIVNGPIKAIIGRGINVQGNIQIIGGAGMIVLGRVFGSREITIGEPASPKTTCVLKFDMIDDLTLKSGTPIQTLCATDWLYGSLEAPWISTMTIKGNPAEEIAGDFGADLQLSGEGSPKGMALKSVRIAGELFDDDEDGDDVGWYADGNCGTIKIASSTAGFTAEITGNVKSLMVIGNKGMALPAVLSGNWKFESVGTIRADDISQCGISAEPECNDEKPTKAIGTIKAKNWIENTTIAVDTTADISTITAGGIRDSDFTTEGSLGRLNVRGKPNEVFCFINSNVEAQHIGTATLLYPRYDNFIDGEHVPFGLTANSIDKLTMTLKNTHQKKTWKGLEAGMDWEAIDDFEVNLQ
jgi:hypothetical protein